MGKWEKVLEYANKVSQALLLVKIAVFFHCRYWREIPIIQRLCFDEDLLVFISINLMRLGRI